MLEEVEEQLLDETAQLARIWRRVMKVERDARDWISDGEDFGEEACMAAELRDNVDALRKQPAQIRKAFRAGKISVEAALEKRIELSSERDEIEQSLASITVPDPRKESAARARELMRDH